MKIDGNVLLVMAFYHFILSKHEKLKKGRHDYFPFFLVGWLAHPSADTAPPFSPSAETNGHHSYFHCSLLYYFIYSTFGLIIYPVVVNLTEESLLMMRCVFAFGVDLFSLLIKNQWERNSYWKLATLEGIFTMATLGNFYF